MTKEDIIYYLNTQDIKEIDRLFKLAYEQKIQIKGTKVYLRGLIELSNKCKKDCYYCGLRCSIKDIPRYELDDSIILEEARFAYESNYGSLVLQAGEQTNREYTSRISRLIKKIKELSNNQLGITLSLGEQSEDTYKEWFDAGAHRYLLRIESSNPNLYYKIHPNNSEHSFKDRLNCLNSLKNIGYRVGTGVMIGLPFQTTEDLANDLLFFRDFGIDMVGMGPYLEHNLTPLYQHKDLLLSQPERFILSIKMVALLRILMPHINIAATTALQVIYPDGREKAILAGANILMPNMTDPNNRENYQIYNNKPGINDDAEITRSKVISNLGAFGIEIGWGEWGDR